MGDAGGSDSKVARLKQVWMGGIVVVTLEWPDQFQVRAWTARCFVCVSPWLQATTPVDQSSGHLRHFAQPSHWQPNDG